MLNATMHSRTVLVADDDRLLRESLCDALTDLGCIPSQAGNGSSAIDFLKQARYDLLLSDVDMPDMTGFALLSWTQQHPPMPSVVLMSARADSFLDRAAQQAGALA